MKEVILMDNEKDIPVNDDSNSIHVEENPVTDVRDSYACCRDHCGNIIV